MDNHWLGSYTQALLSVIIGQLKPSAAHQPGSFTGLLRLIEEVPMVQTALEEYAGSQNTTLPDLLVQRAHSVAGDDQPSLLAYRQRVAQAVQAGRHAGGQPRGQVSGGAGAVQAGLTQ